MKFCNLLRLAGLLPAGVIVSILLLLSACSMRPPVEEARKALETGDAWIKSNLEAGIIKITGFETVGGSANKMAGVKYYTMRVTAKIEYVRDAYGFQKGKTGEWRGLVNFREAEKGWVVLNVAGFMYY